jgi:2Fe-2S ferredoxin
MPTIHFIQHDGTRRSVDAPAGRSVMQAALDNLVPGIIGDCGGCCTCATCHVYVASSWEARIQPKSGDEDVMLEGALDTRPNSRLGCQISVSDALDGLEIELPKTQV